MIKLYVLFWAALEGAIIHYFTEQTLDCIEFLYEIRKREKRKQSLYGNENSI